MKKLSYPVKEEDFVGLAIGERVKVDSVLFASCDWELCLTGSAETHLSRDAVISACDNGTELRPVVGS